MNKQIILFVVLLIGLAACSSTAQPVPSPTASNTPLPSATTTPSPHPTETPDMNATATVEAMLTQVEKLKPTEAEVPIQTKESDSGESPEFDWDSFEPVDLVNFIESFSADHQDIHRPSLTYFGEKYRIDGNYLGESREIDEVKLDFIRSFSLVLGGAPDMSKYYTDELCFNIGGERYWLMVQGSLVQDFIEMGTGQEVSLYVLIFGISHEVEGDIWVIGVNGFWEHDSSQNEG